MMNRELQVQIHDKIFHEIMLAMPIVLFDWIVLLKSVYKKQSEDKDVNQEDDGYEDENVPFLLRAEAHLRLPNYYS